MSGQLVLGKNGVEEYDGALGTDASAQEAMRAAERERAAQPPPTMRQEELLKLLGLQGKRFGLGAPSPEDLNAVFVALYRLGFPQPMMGTNPQRYPVPDEHFLYWPDRHLVNVWLDTFRIVVNAVTLSK